MNDQQTGALAEGLARAARNYNAGRFATVHEVLDKLQEEFGEIAEIEHSRGLTLYSQGRKDAGMAKLKLAANFMPHDGAVRADIGALFAQEGKYEEAISYFLEAADVAPNYAAAWSNLGGAYFMLGEHTQAISALRKAVQLDPNLKDAQLNLGTALAQLRRHRAAVDAFYKVLASDPNDVAAHLGLSGALYRDERHDTALYHARKALELRPNAVQAHLHIGNALASMGQMEEAAEHLIKAANGPGGMGALARLIHHRKTTADSPEFARLQQALDRLEQQPRKEEPSGLYFAAGKAFADLGDYQRSFDYFAKGNAATAKEVSFDLQNHVEQVDRMIEVFSPDLIDRLQGAAGVDDIAPIFVCGMPRSGTTLTELMLSRHSKVQAGGELNASIRAIGQVRRLVAHLEDKDAAAPIADELTQVGEFYLEAVRAEGLAAEIITDKMPINHMYVGLLALALPRAKFVITRRHPLDCCLSNWSQNFGKNQPFSVNFADLGGVYLQYKRVTDYWAQVMPERVMILEYEDLVADPEAKIREVLSFCALDWQVEVLNPAGSSRPVNTASMAQVREPITQNATPKWVAYGALLQPLAEELRPVLTADDLTALGL